MKADGDTIICVNKFKGEDEKERKKSIKIIITDLLKRKLTS